MKTIHKFFIGCLFIAFLVSIGFNIYQKIKERNHQQDLSALVQDQGNNKIIEKYVKDSVTHTIYQDRFINDSKSEKQLAIGKTYADSLQKALKLSIDKIDQVTKINARLEAQMALTTKQTPAGQTVKTHKDQYLDLIYYPDNDSLKMAYDIRLNDARYSEKKWFLGAKQNYINVYSDDKRVTINGLKSYRIKEAPPNRFGIGLSVGYGLAKDGNALKAVPYFGAGLNYNLFEF
jgi:hypothetical protein